VPARPREPLNASKPDPDVIDHGLNSTGLRDKTGLSPNARPEASRAGVQRHGAGCSRRRTGRPRRVAAWRQGRHGPALVTSRPGRSRSAATASGAVLWDDG